jgi:hypothetical protein
LFLQYSFGKKEEVGKTERQAAFVTGVLWRVKKKTAEDSGGG